MGIGKALFAELGKVAQEKVLSASLKYSKLVLIFLLQ